MIFELIYKYLNNEASEDEVASVFEWIEISEENKEQFIAIKKAWAMTATDESGKRSAWKLIEKEFSKVKERKRFNIWKYAAILVVLIGLGKVTSVISNSKTVDSNEVVLEVEKGNQNYTIEALGKNLIDSTGTIIAKQGANEIIYQPKTSNKDIAYHTLKIPYGKTFKVTLSDGSIVHLNSGTTFKYPEQFGLHNNRNVYLTGEAYFEVAKDKNRAFIVHANDIDVEVLGTTFNVSAYLDDQTTHTVLVEGSVRLAKSSDAPNSSLLSPNHKATWNEGSKTFEIEAVDVNVYNAWTRGELVFKDAPFTAISKKLERSYNVKIINEHTFLADQKFTGTIKIKESGVENILDLFMLDTPFEYSKNENTIEITKPSL